VSRVDDVGVKDQDYLATMMRMLGAVDGWAARIDPDAVPGRPSPLGVLGPEDALAHPYELSHAAWHALSHAVDHLSCLRALLKDAHLIHMYAPYSLLRSAVENASAAVWLLQPDSGTERVTRRLRLAAVDIRQGEEVKELTGQSGSPSKQDRLDQVKAIAARAGCDEDKAVRGVGYAEIVRAAGADLPLGMKTVYLSWKLCSGITHGDFWATASGMERVEFPGAPAGTGSFKFSANVQLLMHLTLIAAGMAARGWQLYDQRSRAS
jgi:hypothetical protein